MPPSLARSWPGRITSFSMSSKLLEEKDFTRQLCEGLPWIDLRSEIEFAKGSLPEAINLPILSTEERHRVGLCYKHSGQEAAIALGHKLVSAQVKQERVQAWAGFAKSHPEGALFCWRGGLRSQIAQEWLEKAGIPYPRVAGGFKAIRQFLLRKMEKIIREKSFLIVGGRTGSGKTGFLCQFWQGIDLEALACHRGSAFGGEVNAQPNTIHFENALATALLKLRQRNPSVILLEDEGPNIGRLSLPQNLFQKMSTSKIVVIEECLENRVNHILKTYRFDHPDFFYDALQRISKRLGGERHHSVLANMRQAFSLQNGAGDLSGHREWIGMLLKFYYDPLYDYQLERKSQHVVFRGDPAAVAQYLDKTFSSAPIRI